MIHTSQSTIQSKASEREEERITRFAMRLALGSSILLLLVKGAAYLLTGSSAILSDATESITHLIATGFAVYCLRLSQKPADSTHLYGHAKVAFLSTGLEGALICAAAGFILFTATTNIIRGPKIDSLEFGTILTAVAAAANLLLGLYLQYLGRKHNSFLVIAHGRHVLSDVITTAGVLLGLLLVKLTTWNYWDPICAVVVGLYILKTGSGLVRESLGGLLDEADPRITKKLQDLLEKETESVGAKFHQLRHRRMGDATEVEYHLLLPASTNIDTAHAAASAIEQKIRDALGQDTDVQSHIEPLETHDDIHCLEKH